MIDENRRLAALRAYEVLDTPADSTLDRIAELTACVRREATKRITSAGLAAFVKKPFRPADLLGTLNRLAGQE